MDLFHGSVVVYREMAELAVNSPRVVYIAIMQHPNAFPVWPENLHACSIMKPHACAGDGPPGPRRPARAPSLAPGPAPVRTRN